MHAEVMAIGDELTSGQRLDTNSQWLSQQLGEIGIPVRYHTTVADDLETLCDALLTAARRSQLVLITGGLGPTADDLTRHAFQQAFDRPLRLHLESLQHIRDRFSARGRQMPVQNEVQAMFPEGSIVVPNPQGTAPGIDIVVSRHSNSCRLFALPGVPAEMKEMWQETVEPAIRKAAGSRRVVCHHRMKCFGVGESELEAMLPDLIRRGRDPQVGITVHRATITLRITTSGSDKADCRRRMQPTIATIRNCLGQLVFGQEDEELQDVVLHALRRRQQTIAVCEWATAGLVTRWLSRSDSHGTLRSGLIIPSEQALEQLLNLPRCQAPPDPEEIVRQMAQRSRQATQADYALAIGPLPTAADGEPQLQFAIADSQGVHVAHSSLVGHPDVRLERAAKHALNQLRQLIGQPH